MTRNKMLMIVLISAAYVGGEGRITSLEALMIIQSVAGRIEL
jgi:hypothetical protein